MRRIRLMLMCGLAAFSLMLTACGGSGGDSGSSSGGSAQGKTIWYMDVTDANPAVVAIAQAMNHQITGAGATMVRTFAINNTTGQPDLGVQAQGFSRAIASNPAAVAYFVLDPRSLKPQVEQAQRAGIPVFAAFGKPVGFNVNAYITLNDHQQGFLSAQYLAQHLPKGANVVEITGPPTPNVNAEMDGATQALKQAGVTIIGNLDQQRNLQDNAAGGQQIMQGILQRYPDVQGVFAYNDDTALGAIAAIKAAGKTPGTDIVLSSRNATSDAVAAVKDGQLLATCDIDPIALGEELGNAMVAQISGKKTYKNDTALPPPDASKCLVTSQNVASFVPWDQRIQYQKIKTG